MALVYLIGPDLWTPKQRLLLRRFSGNSNRCQPPSPVWGGDHTVPNLTQLLTIKVQTTFAKWGFLICFTFQESKFFCSRDLLEWGWSDLHGPSRSWTSPTPWATSPTGSIKKRKFWKVWTILTSSVSYYYLSLWLNWFKQHFWNYFGVL